MKDQRPIEVQVAELTPEQRATVKKVFKMQLIIVISALVIGLAVILVAVLNASSAKSAWRDALDEQIAIPASMFMSKEYYEASLAEEEAWEEYDAASTMTTVVCLVCGVGMIAIGLAVMLITKAKYPYYSEKKYFYIKRQEKQFPQ